MVGVLGFNVTQPLASASNPLALDQQRAASGFSPAQAAAPAISQDLLSQGLASSSPMPTGSVGVPGAPASGMQGMGAPPPHAAAPTPAAGAAPTGAAPPPGSSFPDMVGHFLGQLRDFHFGGQQQTPAAAAPPVTPQTVPPSQPGILPTPQVDNRFARGLLG